jgi:tetratricopeptide (TPR) repeat protein
MAFRSTDWVKTIFSIPARRKLLRESSNRLGHYYRDFSIRNKENPPELNSEFKDVIHAVKLLLDLKEWNPIIEIAEALSIFMEERGYWEEALWLHSAALDGVERKVIKLFQLPTFADWHRKIALLTKISGIHIRQGGFQDAEYYLQEALQVAEEIKNKKAQARINNLLGTLSRLQGRFDEAQAYLRKSAELSPDAEQQGESSGLFLQSLSFGNLDNAKKIAQARLSEARISKDISLESDSLCLLGDIAMREEDGNGALSFYQQALAIYEETENQEGLNQVRYGISKIHAALGNFPVAKQILDELLELYSKENNLEATLEILIDKGNYLVEDDKLEEAEKCFQQAINIAQDLESLSQFAICCHSLGGLWEKRNDLENALQFYLQFLGAAEESQHQQLIGIAHDCLGLLLRKTENFEEAREHFMKRLEISQLLHHKSDEASALHLLGSLDMEAGNFSSAKNMFDQATALYKDVGTPTDNVWLVYSRSLLCFSQNDYIRAWELLVKMIPLVKDLGRNDLLELAISILDRFEDIPEYCAQTGELRKGLIGDKTEV